MLKIESLKWSDAIISILKIIILVDRMGEIKVKYNEKLNKQENKKAKMKKIKEKEIREFIFINQKDMKAFIFLIRDNYFKLTGKNLTVELGKE